MKDVKQIVKDAKLNGAEVIEAATVASVSRTSKGNLALVIDKNVPAMVLQDDRTYDKGERNVVYVSPSALCAAIAANPNFAFLKQVLMNNVPFLAAVVTGAKVSVLATLVEAGEGHINPFSESGHKSNDFKHTQFAYDPYNVELGQIGRNMVEVYQTELVRMAIQSQMFTNAFAAPITRAETINEED